MRRISIICFLLAALASCNNGATAVREKTLQEIKAENYGRSDADKVIQARPQSMEREKALLSIRVREYEIRQSGDSLAADAYVNAAKARLDSAGIF